MSANTLNENSKQLSNSTSHERYEIVAKIGSGGYGSVYKAWDSLNRVYVAIKLINLEENGLDIEEEVNQEIAMMANVSCDQLVKYYTSYIVDSNLWIIMEYLEGGSLSEIIKFNGHPLSESSIQFVMRELLKALAYLHSERKIHRDVKASNVLVGADGAIKLADFGVSGQLTESINKRKTRVGSPYWMAPEVITQSLYDGCADIWSTGITAIELAHGKPPYMSSIAPMRVIFLIPKNEPPSLEGDFSPEFKDFVSQCLKKDPTVRPTAAELLNHQFLKKIYAPVTVPVMKHSLSLSSRSSASSDGRTLESLSDENIEISERSAIAAKTVLEDRVTPSEIQLSQIVASGSNLEIKNVPAVNPIIEGQMIKVNKSIDASESVTIKLLRMEGSGSDDSNGSKPLPPPSFGALAKHPSDKSKAGMSPLHSQSYIDGIAAQHGLIRDNILLPKRLNWSKKSAESLPATIHASPSQTFRKPPIDQNSPIGSHKTVAFENIVSPVSLPVANLSSPVPAEFLIFVKNKLDADRLRYEAESLMFESRGLQRIGSADSGSVGGWDFTVRSSASLNQGFNYQMSQSISNSRSNSVSFVPGLSGSFDLEQQISMTIRKKAHSIESYNSSPEKSPVVSSAKTILEVSDERLDNLITAVKSHTPALDNEPSPLMKLELPSTLQSSEGMTLNIEKQTIEVLQKASTQPPIPHRSITPKISLCQIESYHLSTLLQVLKRATSATFESPSSSGHVMSSSNSDSTRRGCVVSSNKVSELFLASIQPAMQHTSDRAKAKDQWQPKRNYVDGIAKTIIASREHRKATKQSMSTSSSTRNNSPTPESIISSSNQRSHEPEHVEEQDGFSKAAAPLISSLLATASATPSQNWFSTVFGFASSPPEKTVNVEISTPVQPDTSTLDQLREDVRQSENTTEDAEDIESSPLEEALEEYEKETEELIELLMATLTALDVHTNGEITREFIVQLASYVIDESDGRF